MIKHRGVDNTIKRVKLMRLITTRYMCGHPTFSSGDVSVSINKRGLPRKLGCLQSLADGGTSEKRLLLTLLSVSRALPGSQYIPDLKPIEDKSSMDPKVMDELRILMPMIFDQMSLTSSRPSFKKFHLTTKAGPNAIAMKSAMLDAHLLDEELYKDIITLGGEKLKAALDEVRLFSKEEIVKYLKFKEGRTPLLRKLSIVHSPERKSRIIAILDYWSQTALKPLHDRIFSILKEIDADCTFRQTNPTKTLVSGPYYSLDLTAATDRFPIEIQKEVVKLLTQSNEYAESWGRVLVNREFYVPWENRSIKYGTGQPMGAYSSWAVFALTHHIIVRLAALKVGKPYFNNYALLGDDIVIGGKDVADSYISTIKSFGVDISDAKSHVSENTFEFAKRWYQDGLEITGAQIHAFTSSKKYYLVANEYKNLCIKWGAQMLETEPGAIRDLFRGLGIPVRLVTKALRFLTLPWDRADISREDQIVRFVRLMNPSALGCFTSAKDRASSWMMSALAEVKSRVLESGLLKARGNAETFIKGIRSILKSYQGMEAQLAFQSIPAVSVAAEQHYALANDLDDIRDPLVTTPEKLIFNEVRYLGFDATRLLTTRSHEILLGTNATLINQLNKWTQTCEELREEILSNQHLDENTERAYARKLFRTKVIGTVMPGFPLSGGEPTS
jgi:hypothetical protein